MLRSAPIDILDNGVRSTIQPHIFPICPYVIPRVKDLLFPLYEGPTHPEAIEGSGCSAGSCLCLTLHAVHLGNCGLFYTVFRHAGIVFDVNIRRGQCIDIYAYRDIAFRKVPLWACGDSEDWRVAVFWVWVGRIPGSFAC